VGLFDKFKRGLQKSRANVWGRLSDLFSSARLDDALYEEIEDVLLGADVGLDTSTYIVGQVRKYAREQKLTTPDGLPALMARAMTEALEGVSSVMNMTDDGPTLVLVVGVNGVGKTTTIGKLAHHYKALGKKVILAAGDTFRAAAVDQLVEWGRRVECDVVRHAAGADPAAVIFDAIAAAKSRKADIILCDTAGRLHNKTHLMAELAKMHKVAARELAGSPHEVLLVVDGTTGQNALSQAKTFQEVVGVTGIVVTKLDGTAKGGVILPIVREFRIPVKWVGLGEQVDDLEAFDAAWYAQAICQP